MGGRGERRFWEILDLSEERGVGRVQMEGGESDGDSLPPSPWKLLFSSAVLRRLQLGSQLCRSLQASQRVGDGNVTPAGGAPGGRSPGGKWIPLVPAEQD